MKLLGYRTNDAVCAFSTYRSIEHAQAAGGNAIEHAQAACGPYEGFNITHYCGDTPEHVAACRAQLCAHLGIDDNRLLLPRQTHSNKVVVIDNAFTQKRKEEQEAMLHGVDALVTALPRTCIGISTADCIPLLLYDTRLNVVAAAHAGWRGTVADIATKTIECMQRHYGCRSCDIMTIVAPGISIAAFEVGDEVYETFARAGFDMQSIAKRYPTATGGEKWHIDLWEANRLQLLAANIPDENIAVAGICTYSNYKEFFSARRLGIDSGRIFSGIMLL